MEKNKLYLSVKHGLENFLESDIRIRIHNDTCYARCIATAEMAHLLPNTNNQYYLYNVNLLAMLIDDLLGDFFFDKDDSVPDETPVVALRIATYFINNNEKQTMWDISDLNDIHPIYGVCCGCHLCDMSDESEEDMDEYDENYEYDEDYEYDEEPEDEEKNYITSMLDRMDDFQDQFYELEHELKNEILKLNNEVFPNNELTARSQIRMINKRIDDLEHIVNNLNTRMTWMDWQLKFQTNELPHNTGDRNKC